MTQAVKGEVYFSVMKNKKENNKEAALALQSSRHQQPDLEKFYQQIIKSFGYEYQRKV